MAGRKKNKADKSAPKPKKAPKSFRVPTPDGDDFVKSMQELLGNVDFSAFEKKVDGLGAEIKQEEQRRNAVRQQVENYQRAKIERNVPLHHHWKVTVAHKGPTGGSTATELLIQTFVSLEDLNITMALGEAQKLLRSERYKYLTPEWKIMRITYKGFVDNLVPDLPPATSASDSPAKGPCGQPGCPFCQAMKAAK